MVWLDLRILGRKKRNKKNRGQKLFIYFYFITIFVQECLGLGLDGPVSKSKSKLHLNKVETT